MYGGTFEASGSVDRTAKPARFQARVNVRQSNLAQVQKPETLKADEGSGDLMGPVTIGLAVSVPSKAAEPPAADASKEQNQPPPPETRVVAIGDSDFATNSVLPNVGNPTLLANAFNWLLERPNRLGIGPKQPEQARLSLTSGQLAAITWGVLAGLPALAAAAGFGVWLRRRR